VLFVRDRILYAQTFDVSRAQVSGDPVPLAENVASTFSVSTNGVAAYSPASSSVQSAGQSLTWRDRAGRVLSRIDQAEGAIRPSISPDGRHLAMDLAGAVWILDLTRGVLSRFAVGAVNGTWSPDGQRLFFFKPAFRDRKDVIFEAPVGNAAKETIVREPPDQHAHVTDVSADGQFMVYEGGEDGGDIWVQRLNGDRKASPYVQTPSTETQGTLSADGRWMAYTSDASGRPEIYVDSFPNSGARIQVSTNGGHAARWRHDGRELFYLAPDGTLMAVPIRSVVPLEFGPPAALFQFFQARNVVTQRPNYDVTPDGQRFIVSAVVRQPDPSLYVLLNWPSLVAGSKP
jgi:Tol biopolymer transport system component